LEIDDDFFGGAGGAAAKCSNRKAVDVFDKAV
jgi:hypothetical protein